MLTITVITYGNTLPNAHRAKLNKLLNVNTTLRQYFHLNYVHASALPYLYKNNNAKNTDVFIFESIHDSDNTFSTFEHFVELVKKALKPLEVTKYSVTTHGKINSRTAFPWNFSNCYDTGYNFVPWIEDIEQAKLISVKNADAFISRAEYKLHALQEDMKELRDYIEKAKGYLNVNGELKSVN